MKIGISVKIDVTKIDKARLFKGEKGTYLDLTTFIDTEQADQYENHGFISQSVTKEEREQKIQTPILGNCRVFFKDASQEQRGEEYNRGTTAARETMAPADNFDDDIPF
jgi:hypothetical protein